VGVRQARQEAEVVADPLIPFSNSKRTGLTTGVDLILPPGSSFTFNAQLDRLASAGVSDATGTSTTLSLGGSLAFGERARLSPNLSWSRTLSDPGDQKMTVANAFLNADFTLVPNILVFTLNGGGSRMTIGAGESTVSATTEGSLRFILDPYLRNWGKATLELKGSYLSIPLFDRSLTDSLISVLLNVTF
jgi:hypothetical protein